MRKKVYSLIFMLMIVVSSANLNLFAKESSNKEIQNKQALKVIEKYAKEKNIDLSKKITAKEFNEEDYANDFDTWFSENIKVGITNDELLDKLKNKLTIDYITYGEENLGNIGKVIGEYFLYNLGVVGDSAIFSALMGQAGSDPLGGSTKDPNLGNYKNIKKRTLTYKDKETGKNFKSISHYLDNGSNKTVVIHGGFRGNWNGQYKNSETEVFNRLGYNLLIVDSRATGGSDGEYVTFGEYEADDVLQWIGKEESAKPKQKIILYGGSMGASTMMSVLAKTQDKHIKALVENCGYASTMGQFKYVYELIATLLENIDGGEDIAQMLGYTKENEEVMLNTINTRYLKAKANMHVERNYPLEGMENKVPKLFIHGGADTFVPTANVYTLYKEAKGYKEILVVPKAGHGQAIFVDPKGYETKVDKFLGKVLGENTNSLKNQTLPDTGILK